MRKTKTATSIGLFISAFVLLNACVHDVAKPNTDGPFFPEVKQIIQANCVSCHSPGGEGLPVILTSTDNIVELAASIKAATIDPASPRNKRMPLGGELSEHDKSIIQKWFDKGGKASD